MITWVLYDIQDNNIRNNVAKICLQAGLYRVQKSVFIGTLDNNQKDKLVLQIQQIINPDKDSVYIFPMSKTELKQTVLIGQAFDKKFVTDKVKALFI